MTSANGSNSQSANVEGCKLWHVAIDNRPLLAFPALNPAASRLWLAAAPGRRGCRQVSSQSSSPSHAASTHGAGQGLLHYCPSVSLAAHTGRTSLDPGALQLQGLGNRTPRARAALDGAGTCQPPAPQGYRDTSPTRAPPRDGPGTPAPAPQHLRTLAPTAAPASGRRFPDDPGVQP